MPKGRRNKNCSKQSSRESHTIEETRKLAAAQLCNAISVPIRGGAEVATAITVASSWNHSYGWTANLSTPYRGRRTFPPGSRLDDLKLDSSTFRSLAKRVNSWAPQLVVSQEEMDKATESEGIKGGTPGPHHLELKMTLLHRMRDTAPQWNH